MVKNLSACSAGDHSSIPGSGRSPEKGMATHSSILAPRIPRSEVLGRPQSIGLKSRTGLSNTNAQWASDAPCRSSRLTVHSLALSFKVIYQMVLNLYKDLIPIFCNAIEQLQASPSVCFQEWYWDYALELPMFIKWEISQWFMLSKRTEFKFLLYNLLTVWSWESS